MHTALKATRNFQCPKRTSKSIFHFFLHSYSTPLCPLPCARVECATWRGNSCSTLGFNSQPENLELFQCICERDSDILHMLLDCSIKGNAVEGGGGNANLGRLNIPMQRRRASSCSCVVAMWFVGGIKLVYDQLTECSAECKNCA